MEEESSTSGSLDIDENSPETPEPSDEVDLMIDVFNMETARNRDDDDGEGNVDEDDDYEDQAEVTGQSDDWQNNDYEI